MTQTFFEYAANRFINMAQVKEIEYHVNAGTFTLKVIAGAGLTVYAPYADKLRGMIGMEAPLPSNVPIIEYPPVVVGPNRVSELSHVGNCSDCGKPLIDCSCVPF